MTRHRDSTLEAGSDSFLDIVANIVGILIILIVVAGLRVAQQPLHPDPEVTEPLAALPQFSIREEAEAQWQPIRDMAVAIAESAIEASRRQREERLANETARLRAEALAEAASLQARLEERRRDTDAAEQLLALSAAGADRRRNELQALDAERTQLLSHVRQLRATVRSDQDRLNARSDELERNQQMMASLRGQAAELASDQANIKMALVRARARVEAEAPETLEHVVTPISRAVEANEYHFRVSGTRVSFIPLDALIERLEDRVRARSDIIMQQQRYDGSVGPLGGFRMHFTAEVVESPSLLKRHSYNEVRLSVTSWQIVPVDPDVEETVVQAARPGSRFQSALEQIPASSTVTFWVYPDSFSTFRELRELARQHGARIAARPLPPGAPIAGSPRGSRSASQ